MNKYIIVFIFILVAGMGWWSWNSNTPQSALQASAPASRPTPIPTAPLQAPQVAPVRVLTQAPTPTQNLDLSNDPRAEKFVRENARQLWQVDPDSLQFEKRDNGERVKLTYAQKFNGVAIFGARLSLFVDGDRLNRVQNTLSQAAEVEGDFALSGAQAEQQLKQQNWQVQGLAEPLFYPTMQKLRPAYRVYATRDGEAQDVIVDAADGRVIRTIPRQHY